MNTKYRIWRSGEYIGLFSMQEIKEITGFGRKTVYKYSDCAREYKGYKFKRVDIPSIAEEWENTRKKLLGGRV